VTTVEVKGISQGGEIWLNARQLIAHLRERAARFDTMARTPDDGYDQTTYQTACWAAAAMLQGTADEFDLECLSRVNGGVTA
jgi:uncharacterized protein (DUF885 family)